MYTPHAKDRLFPDLVTAAATSHGAIVTGFSDNWILRIESNSLHWTVGYSFDINDSGASNVARDKVACYQVLDDNHLPTIEHLLIQTRDSKSMHTRETDALLPDTQVVIKPLSGAGGWEVRRFQNVPMAMTYAKNHPHREWALCPYYEIQNEIRYIICDGVILAAYEKQNPSSRDGLLLYNLGLGAIATDIKPSGEHTDLAFKSMRAIGLRTASIDIAVMSDGKSRIMEINDGITMEHYAKQSPKNLETARETYQFIVDTMLVQKNTQP